jgi:DNA-binding NarL/FixJ family response regulator
MDKLLLVDDHAFLRDALAQVMAMQFPRATVLQCETLESARQSLRAHPDTDLVLLDLNLPDGHGLQALPGLQRLTHARIVAMSADATPATVHGALAAGAVGFLPKTLDADAMRSALTQVMQGGVFVPATLAATAARAVTPSAATPRDDAAHALGLSPRQSEVLWLLIGGARNKQIARQLAIGEATVKTHVTAILVRLGARSRAQAVAFAARLGLSAARSESKPN